MIGSRQQPERDAKHHADPHRDDGDGDRGSRAHHQHRKHVAAEMVRAEKMLAPWRLKPRRDVQHIHRMRCPDKREQRGGDKQRRQRQSGDKGDGKPGPHPRLLSRGSASP